MAQGMPNSGSGDAMAAVTEAIARRNQGGSMPQMEQMSATMPQSPAVPATVMDGGGSFSMPNMGAGKVVDDDEKKIILKALNDRLKSISKKEEAEMMSSIGGI